ncbi:uncharacterized protein LOC115687886 [Syzygium oleosum]|uniref:uncharacterized protein LOC115687886 n=1 Tax=Syzygium oleosum TaxID=219896 RepID=UPI0024B8D3EB|nr:uncharacterized protein LOC115687886 [Syzygium oleosum]
MAANERVEGSGCYGAVRGLLGAIPDVKWLLVVAVRRLDSGRDRMVAGGGIVAVGTVADERLNRRVQPASDEAGNSAGKQSAPGSFGATGAALLGQGKSWGGGGVTAGWSGPRRWLVRRGGAGLAAENEKQKRRSSRRHEAGAAKKKRKRRRRRREGEWLDETSRGLESDDVPKSYLTEEEIQKVVREELERQVPPLADLIMSHILDKIVQPILSLVKDDTIEREVRERLEHASSQSPQLVRSSGKCRKKDEGRNLQLQFKTSLPSSLYTGQKLKGEHGGPIVVVLVNANTGNIVESGPESSIKLKVVVLDGDFGTGAYDNWTQEEFEKSVVREREGKRPLLNGNPVVTLKGGTGVLGDVWFTDNSSWTRIGFRIGLQASPGYCENICEAITEPFTVKESRGQANEKHFPPTHGDEVWRLKNIGRNGTFHTNLSKAGICNVGKFLQLLDTDPEKLRNILGEKMTKNKWDDLLSHAKETCPLNGNRHVFIDNEGDNGRQLTDHTADRVHRAAGKFPLKQENHGETIGKASSSFPSQVPEGHIENLTPVQHNLAPRTCPPVGPEVPLANAGSTAKVLSPGHDGVTALPLPVQSPNTYFGNPVELSSNEIARPVSHQPTFANNWNGLISPGGNGITNGGLPTQPHDINLQYAVPSQMIDPSRQMHSTVNEHVLPSRPTSPAISSFRNGHNGVTALPLPLQSQNTYFGNPMELSANEIACPGSHQPTSANNWNGLISPGDNGITTGGLPTQPHDINLQYAMPSQMIDPSRQMDSTVNEHVLPSRPTCTSISSFRNVLSPGHDGVTALPLPVQSQNTYFGNPMELSANEIARSASHQPTSANNWNGLISPGDNGITTGGLPTQSHDIDLRYTMPSQMIDPSRQMHSTLNEHVLPCRPTSPTISSFRNGHNGVTTLPLSVQSQNTYFGNPMELSAIEISCSTSHQPTSANNWNGLISPGDNGITTGGLPTQSHDINLQYAMPSQMIDPSRQMHSTVNEHVLPSRPTSPAISSFQNGNNGVTALLLPVQSQNTYFGNPMELSANEIARPSSHQPISANNWNGLISPGDNGITTSGLPTQPHDINLQYAMPSQMINPSRQIDSTVNEHVLPSTPTYASISSFQNVLSPGHNGVTALPLPVQSQNTNCGDAMEFPVDESAPPISTDRLNGLFSPGDNGITTFGLPVQSLDNISQDAMRSQMFDPWRQMDSAVNEHHLPSEPPLYAPRPEGDHKMEDFQVNVAVPAMNYSLGDIDMSFQTEPWDDGSV